MTLAKRSLHTILTITGTLALCLGLLVVTASPGTASATTTFTQSGGVFGGGPGLTFSSPGPMSVPGVGDQGPAAPYGSQIAVPYDAPVLNVTLELVLTHTAPTDLDILLVGPHGQQALVMSDAGDDFDVSNYDFVISDDASDPLPGNGPLVSLAYRPADYNGGSLDTFPAPAPAVTGNTALGIFDGSSAAGNWRLFVVDDAAADVGSISSWSLTFDLDSTPYPSTLDVSGLPPVSDVDVTLNGFTSTYPDDMDIMLVGPGGKQATLMSDAGGTWDVSDLTLEFDDEVAAPPADSNPLASGSFKPVNYEPGSDSYGPLAPPPTGNTALSVFDGISPNGKWRLYFRDDNVGDVSTITGWSLTFSFTETQPPSGSVSVADGAATTSTDNVNLSLAATDPAPSSGVTQMRFSNDGTTFSAYQPYAATTAWTLASGDGAKTVFAQFRDADGNQSAVVSDTITVLSAATADITGPRSVKTSPVSGAKGAKTSTRVKVKAGESLEPGSVKPRTVLMKAKGSSHRVRAMLAYRGSSHTIVLTPLGHLKHHTTYRVTVKGVRDLAGNAWDQKPGETGAQALTFRFTTS